MNKPNPLISPLLLIIILSIGASAFFGFQLLTLKNKYNLLKQELASVTPTSPAEALSEGGSPTPLMKPDPPLADTSDWKTYQNTKYYFSFKFPPAAKITAPTQHKLKTPLTAYTYQNLFFTVSVEPTAGSPCDPENQSKGSGLLPENINGLDYLTYSTTNTDINTLLKNFRYLTTKDQMCFEIVLSTSSESLDTLKTSLFSFQFIK